MEGRFSQRDLGTAVAGDGLTYLAGGGVLELLDLSGTKVTDAALARLQALPGVKNLSLVGTAVTDVGLAHLGKVKGLATLNLHGTAVTDAGLARLEDVPTLDTLTLGDTQVTDTGLALLAREGRLVYLGVRSTKVTAKGVADFHAAVPGCRVDHNGGTILAIDVDRRAAEWVVSVGGRVRVTSDGDRPIAAAIDLPKERFELTHVNLDNARASDPDLDRLAFCRKLGQLSGGGANVKITDAGLARLKGHRAIGRIDLPSSGVTDAGLYSARRGLIFSSAW